MLMLWQTDAPRRRQNGLHFVQYRSVRQSDAEVAIQETAVCANLPFPKIPRELHFVFAPVLPTY